ncbi:hypothetical protein L6164_014623 [Bauhinia variegata]|uniref:Uncharacterized protein n=1 Tax=Bauhinia variegata TaxID=167791 RepID=A0ACB9NJC6_BAUVA|nr:hypothetical protein L6164_014623 [Bauhinia variegata]
MEMEKNHEKYDDPKINYRGWKVMPFIIGNETFEKLGAIGTLSNLLVYLTTVFNLENITATNIITIFNGSTNFATLLGAFFSDTYFGRYKTLGFSTVASFVGLQIIQLTAAFKNLHPPHCGRESSTCKGPTVGQMGFLLLGLGSLLVGAAGVRPCYLIHINLDKAAIVAPKDQINPDGSPRDPWNLCSVQQVEEVKCLVRVIPIWVSAIIYHLVIVQQHTLLVFQALQSDRRFGHGNFKIPGASYFVFQMLSMTLWLPIYDRKVVPFLRRLTGKETGITILQRMGIGLVLATLSILLSAVVEERRRTLALTNPIGVQPRKGAISSMSGFWFIPQLALAGVAEAFTSVGHVEFYFKQFPENMRSIEGSLFYCAMAGSNYLNTALISVIHHFTAKSSTGNWLPEDLNKGRLDYFYYMITALEAMNLGYFLLCAKWYKYKGNSSTGLELEKSSKQSETATANGV